MTTIPPFNPMGLSRPTPIDMPAMMPELAPIGPAAISLISPPSTYPGRSLLDRVTRFPSAISLISPLINLPQPSTPNLPAPPAA